MSPASVKPSASLSAFACERSVVLDPPPPAPFQADLVEQLRLELQELRGKVDLLAVDTSGQERLIRVIENDIQT